MKRCTFVLYTMVLLFSVQCTEIVSTPQSIAPSAFRFSRDVDRDGLQDFVVTSLSQVHVYTHGGTTEELLSFPADAVTGADESFPTASMVGDVNGDQYADVLVGAPLGGCPAPKQEGCVDGIAYLYYGSPGGMKTTPQVINYPMSDSGSRFGAGIAPAGDINKDGFDDFVITAPKGDILGNDPEEGVKCVDCGRAYLYYGSATGNFRRVRLTNPDRSNRNTGFGVATSDGGDFNGDGYPDLAIGTFSASPPEQPRAAQAFEGLPGQQSSVPHGRVYVYYGSSQGIGFNPEATLAFPGNFVSTYPSTSPPLAFYGSVISNAGDVDGDGYEDLLVGAFTSAYGKRYKTGSGNTVGEGDAFLYFGGPDGLSHSRFINLTNPYRPGDAFFGATVSGIGDINADGFSDFIVGAPGSKGDEQNYNCGTKRCGVAVIHMGGKRELISQAVSATESEFARDVWAGDRFLLSGRGAIGSAVFFGNVLSGIGDINGDGLTDFAVRSPKLASTTLGSTYSVQVFFGSTRLSRNEVIFNFQADGIELKSNAAEFGFSLD